MSEHPSSFEPYNRKMATALVAIQELHRPVLMLKGWDADSEEVTEWVCKYCTSIAKEGTYFAFPCPSRRLADEARGGDNNG